MFRPTVLLALALMTVLVMMILPMPAWVLDAGLSLSFGMAILIFTMTLFIDRPLDFSSFPTLLLASLMLRLSLNVSSTKLIIGEGHTGTAAAGDVIEGFAMFIMGGSLLIGLIVFGVLMIVNFIVITKGAGRMAEVGARFALDAMPGKQLAIDSDMAAGVIDHAEARARRERDQAEASFFGSLDGVSKFVKGDAIAGLLITLLNLIGGLIVGVVLHGLSFGDAVETYAILTVGDGLVTQLPAVIISIASALLLARGAEKGSTDLAVFSQLSRYPAALTTVGALMILFGLVPGMPLVPFSVGGIILVLLGEAARRNNKTAVTPPPEPKPAPPRAAIGDILDLDDLHVEFAADLVTMVIDPALGLDARIGNMRRHIAQSYGLILPEIRLTDAPDLPPGRYIIRVQGVEQGRDTLYPDRLLAIDPGGKVMLPDGLDVREPVYGAPARWISPEAQEDVALAGITVVTPTEVLATHLLEVMKRNFGRLLTLKTLRRMLHEVSNLTDPARAEANRRLLDELVPEKVPIELLLTVMRLLLDERVSIRNWPLILETIAEVRGGQLSPEMICELVRQRLGFQLVADLRRPDGSIPLIQLAPEWEQTFREYQHDTAGEVALPPDQFNRLAGALAEKIAKAGEAGTYPAVVTSPRRRRFLRMLMAAKGLQNPVLSFDEIGTEAQPTLVGVVAA